MVIQLPRVFLQPLPLLFEIGRLGEQLLWLSSWAPLEIKLDGNTRSSSIEFTITGYTNIPSDVTFSGTSTTDWGYDAALGRVTLQVTNPGLPGTYPTWKVIP